MPINVPWFPDGDPLLPENRNLDVKLLHRYIGDVYQTYDVLYALQWGRGPTNELWPLKGSGVIVPAFQFYPIDSADKTISKWMVYERFTPWLDSWANGYLDWVLEIHTFYQGRYDVTNPQASAYIEKGIFNYKPKKDDLDFREDIEGNKDLEEQRKELSITYLVTDLDLSVTKIKVVMDSDFKFKTSLGEQGPLLIYSVVVNGPSEIKKLVEARLNSLSEYLLWDNRYYPTFYLVDEEDKTKVVKIGEITRTDVRLYYWDVLPIDVYAWKRPSSATFDWTTRLVLPDEYPIDVIKSFPKSMNVPGAAISKKIIFDPETGSYITENFYLDPSIKRIPYDDNYVNGLIGLNNFRYYRLPFSVFQNETREKSRLFRQFRETDIDLTNSRDENGRDLFYDSISALKLEYANNNYWNDSLLPPPDNEDVLLETYIAKEVKDFPDRDDIEDKYLELRFRVPTSPTMTKGLFVNKQINEDNSALFKALPLDAEFSVFYERFGKNAFLLNRKENTWSSPRRIGSIQVFDAAWIDDTDMILIPEDGPNGWSSPEEFPNLTVGIAMLGGGASKNWPYRDPYGFYPWQFTRTFEPLIGSSVYKRREWVSTSDETSSPEEREKNNSLTLIDRNTAIEICNHWWSVTEIIDDETEVKNTMVDSIRVKNNNVYLQELSRFYGIKSPFDDYSIEPLTAITDDSDLDPEEYPTFKFAKDARQGNPASSWGTVGVKVIQSSTRFEGNPETGEEQIVFDEYYQAHNILQVLATIGEQLDRVLDFLATSANYINPAHNRGELCKVEGIYSLLSETLYMNSQLDQTTKKTLINAALCQAMLIELIRHKGVQATTKYLKWDIGGGQIVKQPYEALAPNAPTEYQQYVDILDNLAYLLAGATKTVVTTEDDGSDS